MENFLFSDKITYHIYPLGLFNCPKNNDFTCPAGNGFDLLQGELERIKDLGANLLYIGPICESSKHGYDTLDYYHVDRRLGNNEKFASFCNRAHEMGFSIVLDAVFNHTGRDFFAFKDLLQNGQNSPYKDWYLNLHFDRQSNYGDPFDYDGWAGCKDLVKLNVDNPQVQEHLFGAVEMWMKDFNIDGLRLDAADVLSKNFMDNLNRFCKSRKQDFWLMGEVVHGDYNDWVRPGRLDSVTNYQIYTALYSGFNDANFFDPAFNLNREFGDPGIYNHSPLYTFLDNHDVNRIASTVKKPEFLYPLYGLAFTIPGIPSIYYGSEFAIQGKRGQYDDFQLRPSLPPFAPMPDFAKPQTDPNALVEVIKRFAKIRQNEVALQKGSYRQIAVTNTQFMFERKYDNDQIVIAVNCEDSEKSIYNNLDGTYEDLLNGGTFSGKELQELKIPAIWIRILKKK